MRVGFLIAGAQKAGTTALHHFLAQHPEIGMSKVKELHWFDVDDHFGAARGVEAYHARFTPRPEIRIFGESTPAYMYVPSAAPRIAQYNPAMKLVLILRDPIDRAFSHYRMVRDVFGAEPLSFEAAVAAERGRLAFSDGRTSRGSTFRRHAYVARGLYAQQIERLRRDFAAEQMLLLRSEELRSDHATTLRRVHQFLGVSPEPIPEPVFIHSQGEQAVPREIRRQLLPLFEDDLMALEQLTGWDLRSWRSP